MDRKHMKINRWMVGWIGKIYIKEYVDGWIDLKNNNNNLKNR